MGKFRIYRRKTGPYFWVVTPPPGLAWHSMLCATFPAAIQRLDLMLATLRSSYVNE